MALKTAADSSYRRWGDLLPPSVAAVAMAVVDILTSRSASLGYMLILAVPMLLCAAPLLTRQRRTAQQLRLASLGVMLLWVILMSVSFFGLFDIPAIAVLAVRSWQRRRALVK